MIYEVDFDKIIVSCKVSFDKKSFIGYRDNENVKPLSIMLPQMSACRK